MGRAQLLIRHPFKAIGSLALVLAAVSVAVGSGANFSSNTANPSNAFTAGNLRQTNSKDGTAILTAVKMKPGDTTNGTVTITNSGDIAGSFSLAKSNVSDTPGANGGQLSAKLNVKVEDVTEVASPVVVYNGVIGSMGSQSLGSFAVNEARTYKFTVTFPDGGTPSSNTTGDNAYKGSSMSIEYDWNAVS